jgi:uncharacterized protein
MRNRYGAASRAQASWWASQCSYSSVVQRRSETSAWNLYTAQVNFGADPVRALDALPLDRIAYAHVAGGTLRDGLWHDTHAHPVPEAILDVLAALAERVRPPGVLLERDDAYPADSELAAELAAIRAVVDGGRPRASGLAARSRRAVG